MSDSLVTKATELPGRVIAGDARLESQNTQMARETIPEGGDLFAALEGELLILSNYFHPEPTGSAPPITDLAAWAGEQGLQPHVLTARPSYPRTQVYPGYEAGQKDHEVFSGTIVRRVPSFVPRSRGLLGRMVGELSFAASAALHRKRRYAGVICVCPSIFVVLIAPMFRRRGGRVVAIVHDIQSGLAQSLNFGGAGAILKLLQGLERWSLNRCDRIVALTDSMAAEIRALGVTRPIDILPPQVNVQEIIPQPEPETGPPTLLYSGNLGRKQGLDQILALAGTLKDRGHAAVIHIRGEGSERVELEREAAASGLDKVRFSDLAPRAGISEALGDAVLHLVPQDPAGAQFALPSKVFSIMAAQRAFVATADADSPLGRVVTRSGGGLCVPAGAPEALADAVVGLLADPAARSRMGASGRQFVEQEIDREIVCGRLLMLLIA
jgi:colanic acid biosynthesis glycosyl transferase WcaI